MGKLNEAFSSRKLADMAKQHGGIEISINGGMRNGANAFHGGSSVDVSKITDDMLSGEPFKYDYKNTPDKVAANLIHFKDGYAVSLKPYDLKSDNNIKPERPRQKPSRYGTGIGDTGDHNKKESPFFKNGKKDVGPEYNGFGVSSRAGESQHYREAIKNNKNDIKYYEEHPDGEYSKNAINRAKKNIQTIKGYGKELLNKRKNESKNMKKNVVKLNEAALKKIVAESVKNVLKEGYGDFREADENKSWDGFKYDDLKPSLEQLEMLINELTREMDRYGNTASEEQLRKGVISYCNDIIEKINSINIG